MNNIYIKCTKPIIDTILALAIIIIVLPIILLLTLLLLYSTKGKPFFRQARPGRNAKIFGLIKFRTMRDAFDEQGNQLPDKYRITKIGRFIRTTSLDELPQMINVLKGDMSLIGPRPLLVKYLPLYNDNQARRHKVKPGITGWTQVNGRNSLSWKEKFKLDVWYVDNISFLLDLKIFFLTIKKVIKRDGINSSKISTMPLFNGNN